MNSFFDKWLFTINYFYYQPSLSIIHKTYLHMADRASMYATLEARVPFMDKELVKFSLSLPSELQALTF